MWVFTISVDGAPALTSDCSVSGDARTVECGGDAGISAFFTGPDRPLSAFRVEFNERQDALPETVEITVEHDGVSVVTESVQPAYDPVDEKCEPGCVEAPLELPLG
jgi:hypothetical protein